LAAALVAWVMLPATADAIPMLPAPIGVSRLRDLFPFFFRAHESAVATGLEARFETTRSIAEFDVDERVVGLFLEVRGTVEFERVDIECSDGRRFSVDAFGEERSTGLYELVRFDGDRSIHSVRLIARAKRHPAQVGLRLGV
jgi:hypothetical protein